LAAASQNGTTRVRPCIVSARAERSLEGCGAGASARPAHLCAHSPLQPLKLQVRAFLGGERRGGGAGGASSEVFQAPLAAAGAPGRQNPAALSAEHLPAQLRGGLKSGEIQPAGGKAGGGSPGAG
jgi:hypothetical protein